MNWIPVSVATGLGWALVHFLWQGTAVALVLAAALPMCRGARLRYALACAAMLAMLALFAGTAMLSVPEEASAPHYAAAPANAASAAGQVISPPSGARIQAMLPWLVPLWLIGVALFGFLRVGGWAEARRMRGTGVCAVPRHWQQRLMELAAGMRVAVPVALLESSLAEVPVVIGILRPVILTPAGFLSGLGPAHVEAILLHELAHIRRFDYAVNLLQAAMESLLFYHPAVWRVSRLMRTEREHCCDDMVVAAQGGAGVYAEALVALEERRAMLQEPVLAATGGDLLSRVRRLLGKGEEPRPAATAAASLGLLLGLFALVAVAQQPGENKAAPYQKWVDEDVAHIIRDEERAAFRRLMTDEERARFIEQFWQRRDPTPGTADNEFKSEHYRRITYSNERFGAKTMPGWKTDRGRIYIVTGPPGEIESHPREGREQWLYNFVEGIGKRVVYTFTDPARSGEYRLAGPPAPLPARR